MILTRTPFRISFFGGGTDYPAWYREHGGAVLGATIDKYCWIAVRTPPWFGPKYRLTYSRVECCESLDEIQHPAVRECLRYLNVPAAEISHWSDLPARSGVGSSSAFVVGLLNALYMLHPDIEAKSQEWLAADAARLEQDVLKETVGSQDQWLTAIGGLCRIDFGVEARVQKVGLSVERLAHLNDHLMLFYTGIQRNATDIAASYVNDFPARASLMRQLKVMVDAGEAILKGGVLYDFGSLLDEAWAVKRQLGHGISNPRINALYDTAKRAGALGGKVLGAGGGGHMLFFVLPDAQDAVRSALDGLHEVPFRFEQEGSVVV